MESVFANDSTADLQIMLESTQEQMLNLQDEVESCQECIYDIKEELAKRG